MPLNVSYMGTKRQLAGIVLEVLHGERDGPLLDLFSGMCAITSAVAPYRQVWTNDVQIFASTVASSFFGSRSFPLSSEIAADLVLPAYKENRDALESELRNSLNGEQVVFATGSVKAISLVETSHPHVANSEKLERRRKRFAKNPRIFPYQLFTISYSGGYLSLQQCIGLDSLRYAFDQLLGNGQIDFENHRWLCLALCQAMSKVATTTGHFAQYMTIKKKTKQRYLAQRRRSIWKEWLRAIDEILPVGSRDWRARNRFFSEDALTLIHNLQSTTRKPAVIYADPPYTDDQYSRYYHLYETLILYDYPPSQYKGRYRPDRFVSSFSSKANVADAIERLIDGCANLGSSLVLSYPSNGLLPNSKSTILGLMRKRFRRTELSHEISHFHSCMGGSKGIDKSAVTEMVFTASMK